jgi:hypothetical protein
VGKARRESANRRVILSMTQVEEEVQSGGGKTRMGGQSRFYRRIMMRLLPFLSFGVGDNVEP